MASNFQFLDTQHFYKQLIKVEKFAITDPRYSAFLMRLVVEATIKKSFAEHPELTLPRFSKSLNDLLEDSDYRFLFKGNEGVLRSIHDIRIDGNKASHEAHFKSINVLQNVRKLHRYLLWFALEVLEMDIESIPKFTEDLIPTKLKANEDLVALKNDFDELLQQQELIERKFAEEIKQIQQDEALKRKKLLEQLEKQPKEISFKEVGLTEQLNLIWGRTFVNFTYLDEKYHAVKYFQNEGGAKEKFKVARGDFESIGLWNVFEVKHNGLSVQAVLEKKFDDLPLVTSFSKERFGTPSILLKKLIKETEERILKRTEKVELEDEEDQLHKEFSFKGNYYKKEGLKFRNILEINRQGIDQSSYDLIVVMLNPGGSHPLDDTAVSWRDASSEINSVDCKPDQTQYQIARVMNLKNYNKALVLNLFDKCNTNSHEIIEQYVNSSDKGSNLIDSIFHLDRREEFNELLASADSKAPMIIAWGVNSDLLSIKKNVEQKILTPTNRKIIGWKKMDYQYYHPWPRETLSIRKDWPNEIMKQLNQYD
jgi:hypothetical protein